MSVADDRLREGRLDDALAELKELVRKHPAEVKYRIFLFQLLAILGDWERALTQLNVAGDLDPGTLAMVATYREALHCEVLRAGVFGGERSPLFFGEPQEWMALTVEALRVGAQGRYSEAQSLRDQAFEVAQATPGSLDGQAFEWLADADPRLGPILEAIVNGNYYWVPFQHITRIAMEAPSDLRDFVWMPAQFTWANGGEVVGLIPTRYPGSESSGDAALRMAKRTEWVAQAAEFYVGAGQRMLATDQGEYPLMDIRQVELRPGAAEQLAAGP